MTSVAEAIQHYEAGRLIEAEQACRAVLGSAPQNPDALNVLALTRQRLGDFDEAIGLLQQLRQAQPANTLAIYNLAVAFHEAGDLDAAVRTYRDVLKLSPEDADVHYNLGVVQAVLGKLDLAVQSYRRALKIAPDFASAHNNLGNALRAQGHLKAAAESYRAACKADPRSAEAHVNLAKAAAALGDDGEASLHFSLAAEIEQRSVAASLSLADGLVEVGRSAEAVPILRDLLAGGHGPEAAWSLLATAVAGAQTLSHDDKTTALLMGLLERPTVAPADIAAPLARCVMRSAGFEPTAGQLAKNALLCRLMTLATIPEQDIEAVFTATRRSLLEAAAAGKLTDEVLPYAIALARQAFLSEYVWTVSDEEQRQLDALSPASVSVLAVLAAYAPLHALGRDRELIDTYGDGPAAELIQQQVLEPAAEKERSATLQALTDIHEDGVSAAVQAQYEENPYPSWTKAALVEGGSGIAETLGAPPFEFDVRSSPKDTWQKVLIAGCGTGQHAIMAAARFPDSDVLAVDLSRTSLGYAARMAAALGIENIRFAQADILGIKDLGETFDVIESVGVLHHMGDPAAGWESLVSRLRPGGLMKIGVYSDVARRDITAVAAMLAADGFKPTPDGLRAARTFVRARAAEGDKDMRSVSETSDFFSASECRDMLFHVQEHRMTIPWIKTQVARLNLHFLGFEIRNPVIRQSFRQSYPGVKALRSLANWEAFEAAHPMAFREMYQFWCQKR